MLSIQVTVLKNWTAQKNSDNGYV